MREILFRGKTDFNVWATGSLIQVSNFCCILSEDNGEDYDYPYLDGTLGTIDGKATPIQPETIGQYTGFIDKNGTKIFEGDIVKGSWNTIFQVYYDDCYLQFRAKEKTGFCKEVNYYGLDKIEVIGNIHDNPELIDKIPKP